MNEVNAQEILFALPTECHLIDLTTKTIVQSNNPGVKPGMYCYKAIYGKDLPCVKTGGKCICEISINKKTSSEFVVDKAYKDGVKYFRVIGKLLKENLALVNCVEVTEHVLLQQEVENEAKRLESAEKLAAFGYWELDPATKMVAPSKGAAEIYGVKYEGISLEDVAAFTLESYREYFNTKLSDLLEKGQSFDIQYKIRRPSDNEIRHIHAIADFRSDKNIAFGVVHDVSEAVAANDAILENDAYLKLLFQSMNSAFAQHKIITDENGEPIDYEFLDVNPKFEEFTGLKKDTIVGKTARQVLPKLEDVWIKRYGKVALSGEPIQFTEYSADFERYFEVSAYSPQQDFFAVSFTDVTQRMNAVKVLEEAKEKAIESDRLKTIFLANMSHEIRTPLNGILGFSSLLIGEDLDSEQRVYFGEIIRNSGNRLLTVIDDIINISMIQSNQLKIEYAEFDIHELLHELYVVYSEQYHEDLKTIDFKLQLCPRCTTRRIYSDKNRVYQVLKNLLDNAFKFTSEGSIVFGVRKERSDELELFVKDSGVGISKAKQDVVFDVFRQAEEGQSRKYDGSGLGLAIVSGILEKLGGSVEVYSDQGEGAEFLVSVPTHAHKVATKEEADLGHDIDSEKLAVARKIISFEDDESSAAFMKTVVESMGYEWENFMHAEKGLEYLQNNEVDMVFMDIQLPEMNGYDATSKIKDQYPDVPVIIQTAFAMAGDEEKAFEAGCDDYMAKPLNATLLRNKIKKYLTV